MITISRTEALEKGLKHYFTGKTCKRGHITERFVTNLTCVDCVKEKWVNRDVQKSREYNRAWYATYFSLVENKKKGREVKNKWILKNKDRIKYLRVRRKSEMSPEERERAQKLRRYNQSLRRVRKKSATPIWANKELIKKIYLECPYEMTVDHIIPLKGIDSDGKYVVCGLHVETNLQYLTASDNSIKKNRVSHEDLYG